jgi:hypothetical protein
MLKIWLGLFAVLAMLAGCTSMSTGHQAGGPRPDLSYLTATLNLDDQMIGSTHAGTYMRLEVAPGRHRITGYGQDNGAITLDVQADRVYFVRHTVSGSWRATNPHSHFSVIDEAQARAAMAGAVNAQG